MKIFYINVIERNAGWGAECFVNKGFIKNGHQTINLDFRINRYHLSSKFLEINCYFDILFLQRGDSFPIELLKAVNRPRFFWASELIARCRDQDRLLSSGLFEHIFVRTLSCKQTIINNRWMPQNKVSILLSGFDEDTHFNIPTTSKDIDILFIGSVSPRRRVWLNTMKKYFTIVEAKAYGVDMTKMFNRAKIILNIHAEDYQDTETRVFEVLGSGSFLLSEKLSPENPFSSGKHLVEVATVKEMIEKIDYYLNNDDEREVIAFQGHKEALAKHTYTERAKEIVSIFHQYLGSKMGLPIDTKKVVSYQKKEKILKLVSRINVSKKLKGIIKRMLAI